MERRTLNSLLLDGTNILKKVSQRPAREAEILLLHLLQKERIWLMLNRKKSADRELDDRYALTLARRAGHEPVEYITGEVSFYSEQFYIDSGALIPRPETEILIDEIVKRVDSSEKLRVAEIGIGSGVISIILAKLFPEIAILATDISSRALAVARRNIERFGVGERVELFHTSMLDGIDERVDILVSNPPYIKNSEKLEPNLSYEPQNALFSGEDGTDMLYALIDEGVKRNVKLIACEMGYGQRFAIESYVKSKGLDRITFYKDYAKFDRGFIIELQ